MTSLTDWLAATFYTPQDLVDTHEAVAASQRAINDRQFKEGKTDFFTYVDRASQISDAGHMLQDFKEENGGALNTWKVVPWYLWAGLLAVGFWYLGGFYWVKNLLKPKTV